VNEIFSRSQYAITDSLMNSPPLSVSIPRIGKGKSVRARPDGCQDRLLAPMQEGKALGPACGHEGRASGCTSNRPLCLRHSGLPRPLLESRDGSHSTPRTYESGSAASGAFPLALWRGREGLLCAVNASLRSAEARTHGKELVTALIRDLEVLMSRKPLQVRWGERG
jgi:hypothetical protein